MRKRLSGSSIIAPYEHFGAVRVVRLLVGRKAAGEKGMFLGKQQSLDMHVTERISYVFTERDQYRRGGFWMKFFLNVVKSNLD